jgi:pyruvate dehydrogenase E1 component alpha subunit
LISNEKLLELYAAMVKCRIIGDTHPFLDATLAGVTSDLLPGDTLVPTHSALMPAPFAAMFPPNGKLHSNAAPKQNGHVPADPLTVAYEAATASRAAKTAGVAVVICTPADTSQKAWQKKMSIASRRNLPLLIVCAHDSAPAIPPPRAQKNGNPQALAFGIPVIAVDALDVVAVYRVASESIARARQRRGPTLIESVANSALNQAATNGRSPHRDAIQVMEAYLSGKGLFSPEVSRSIADKIRRELNAASRFQSN